jgi:hypothetical protein
VHDRRNRQGYYRHYNRRRQEIRQETQSGRRDREAGQTEMKIEFLGLTVKKENQIRQEGKTDEEDREAGNEEDK